MYCIRSKAVALASVAICITAVVAGAGPISSLAAAASAKTGTQYPYTLIDPGTFGGPNSYLDGPGVPVTNNGTFIGQADTTARCPSPGPCEDSYIQHAFTFQDGRLTDLGVLPGDNSSAVWELNSYGVGVGNSEDGIVDPHFGTDAFVAVMFDHGKLDQPRNASRRLRKHRPGHRRSRSSGRVRLERDSGSLLVFLLLRGDRVADIRLAQRRDDRYRHARWSRRARAGPERPRADHRLVVYKRHRETQTLGFRRSIRSSGRTAT